MQIKSYFYHLHFYRVIFSAGCIGLYGLKVDRESLLQNKIHSQFLFCSSFQKCMLKRNNCPTAIQYVGNMNQNKDFPKKMKYTTKKIHTAVSSLQNNYTNQRLSHYIFFKFSKIKKKDENNYHQRQTNLTNYNFKINSFLEKFIFIFCFLLLVKTKDFIVGCDG